MTGVTDAPASLARVLGAEPFASEAASELWARSIAALESDRAELRERRRLAREAEHARPSRLKAHQRV